MDCSAPDLEQKHSFNEVIIKCEPPDPVASNEAKLAIGSIQIKIEPADESEGENVSSKPEPPDEHSTLLNNLNTSTKENITIKVEPVHYDSDDERPLRPPIPRLAKNAAYKMYKEKEELDDQDKVAINSKKSRKKTKNSDEQMPLKFKTIARKGNIDITKKEKVKNDDDEEYRDVKKLNRHRGNKKNVYPESVTDQIEIVTISESERASEHSLALAARRHMRHVCSPCATGFVLHSAYLQHMRTHDEDAGEFECDICHLRIKSMKMLKGHKLRHYRRYRCKICGDKFKWRDRASGHVLNEHKKKMFACDKCDSVFKRPKYLKRHQDQYHIKPIELECPVCKKIFYEKTWYRCHVRSHSEEVKTQTVYAKATCPICKGEFRNKGRLSRHLLIHQLNVTCDVCNLMFKNADTLKRHYFKAHKRNYMGPKEEPCPHCDRVLTTKSMLARHVQRMHMPRTRNFECDHCHRLYQSKAEVRAHIMWSHLRAAGASVAEGHRCGCGKEFRTPSKLRAHERREHLRLAIDRKHACDECGKAFETLAVLRRHKEIHTNETYPCNECGREFKTRSYVTVHYKLKHLNMTRSQIRQQNQLNRTKEDTVQTSSSSSSPICIECGRDFQTRTQLNLHFWRRHSERTKEFECDYCKKLYWTKSELRSHIMWSHLRGASVGGGHMCTCGKRCRTPANLRAHVLQHHGDRINKKNHECDQCGKSFSTKQLLGRHKARHIDGEPFPCTICDKKFKTQAYLCAHYRRMHPDAYPTLKKGSNKNKPKANQNKDKSDDEKADAECIPTDFLVVNIKEEVVNENDTENAM